MIRVATTPSGSRQTNLRNSPLAVRDAAIACKRLVWSAGLGRSWRLALWQYQATKCQLRLITCESNCMVGYEDGTSDSTRAKFAGASSSQVAVIT